ncbi:MAG: 4Fe-4S binding protein [Muribaculaceae bacterium]|nr:4Fe-4S binding protein [Muribaculaceae bacterium]
MLRSIRIIVATLFFLGITLLFLDFTGSVHSWLGWMAKIQFLPAVLALNVGVIVLLLAVTLLFGRVYCSVICPLGILQDIFTRLGAYSKKRKYRFAYSPAVKWLRYSVLALFLIALVAGIGSFVALLAPYSSYGRIAQNLFSPIVIAINNVAADIAEYHNSYAFYTKDTWIKAMPVFVIAVVTFVTLFVLAWRNGRTYCNTICPVGTVLGFLSRFSWLSPVIDKSKCNACGLCSKRCKAACIDGKNHVIDYSRCVACMDCIDTCTHGAISYTKRRKQVEPVAAEKAETSDNRRSFLTIVGGAVVASTIKAEEKTVDGGLAVILDKKIPERKTPLVPAGSQSLKHFRQHCTGCQLCVSQCPNDVLRPSTDLRSFMQPVMSYERGYCRPECTRCSQVCPAGAIKPIDVADKSSISIGHAVWVRSNCIVLTDGVSCGNCARHCPSGAITMVLLDSNDPESRKIPSVNAEKCIGCGACEYVCPARPFSAIYVEGNLQHRII